MKRKVTTVSERNYVRWDANGVENIRPNEQEDTDAIIAHIHETQRQYHEKNGHCFGSTHARTNGIVKGNLVFRKICLNI